MRLTNILICFSLLLFATGCNSRKPHIIKEIEIDETLVYPLTFTKELETVIDAEGAPEICDLQSKDRILVRMEKKGTLFLKYNLDLELLETHEIPYGRGPDELLMPLVQGGYNDDIVIFDNVLRKYFLYDGNLKQKKALKTKPPGEEYITSGVKYSRSQNTFLACFANSAGRYSFNYRIYAMKVHANGITGTEIFKTDFNRIVEKKFFVAAHPLQFKLMDNSVYVLQKEDYRIFRMDVEGNIGLEVKVKNIPDVVFTRRQRTTWVKASGFKKPIFIFPRKLWPASYIIDLGEGFAVGRRNDYKPIEKDWLEADYFDKDLNYMGKIKLPGFSDWNYPAQNNGTILFKCIGNKLFQVRTVETPDDEIFKLTRWRLEYVAAGGNKNKK